MNGLVPTEYEECKTLVEYMNLLKLEYWHIHQEMYTKSWSQKRKAKELGVRKGFPDYAIIIKGKLIFIEMKRSKGSNTSQDQKLCINNLNNCEGVEAFVCKGFAEAKAIIDRFFTK